MRHRRIAAEEAFATPEQLAAYRLLGESGWRDPDVQFWKGAVAGAFDDIVARLLDVGEGRVAAMDRHGIDVQILSLTSPGVQLFAPARASELARASNDLLAAAIARHPTRFAGLAAVAPHDPAGAVREMERAIGSLGLKGILINSHTDGRYLDEAQFLPVLEAAEAMAVPVYLHPRSLPEAAAAGYGAHHLNGGIWGYAAETGLHAVRLIMAGVFARLPGLRIVLGHLGEGLPWWLYRLDYMYKLQSRRIPRGANLLPSDYVRQNFWITTSGMNDADAVRFCIAKLGVERVLWAVDYPYQEAGEAVSFLNAMDLPAAHKRAIFGANAERLFGIAALEQAA
ncbi:amidohydrolase family protein [Sphingomonas baiyangensis]|uniref:Amidohydrolase n=1 Tax=Sphingomonas baiyangensis TaxID=2572576 RepID=A0A4U1L1B1_9SPHN|nr:amidohydrolase family protein [Sphingomonas baiyangensis]TKD49883.1 amidohydrolase [Sphingomonas baiyangensis]